MAETSDQLITLKTINDLRLEESGNPQRYHIAAYQRGYRWSPVQVTQLLDDIREFTQRRNPQPDHFYCLQPIVLKIAKGGGYEVVDGQQRLTTLLLILRCFNEFASQKRQMASFTLDYETRPSLDAFLADPNQKDADSNIDFYHLFKAMNAIEKWFDERENEVDLIKNAFLNQTKVIWFQLSDSDNPVDAFTRLNVGKIPLTDDELIRALFLRRPVEKPKNASDLQLRIAHEWDIVEKTLQNDAFWYFLSNEPGATQNRIGFLFHLVAVFDGMSTDATHDQHPVFNHFSEKLNADDADPEMEWRRAKQMFMMLEEWYDDRTLFHIVGFLVHTGKTIGSLVKLSQGCTKDQFEKRLRDLVFKSIIGSPPEKMTRAVIQGIVSERLETLQYGRPLDNATIRSVLLLFNVATLLESKKSNLRFQFDSFKCGEWDIEHVRSVSADDLNSVSQRNEWLTEVRGYFESQDEQPDLRKKIDAFLAKPNPKSLVEEFAKLYETIVKHFDEKTEPEPDHGLANLVLLDAATNRSYKNAVFALKRQRLLSLDRAGIFVPLCTRNVFLKCYSQRVDHAMFWKESDRDAYLKAMTTTLTDFFVPKPEVVQ
ncbi:hypothetical protein FHS27_001314 [Rhodopirellula rubra]|uniref:GmrSD restriction endonucleases N-terminal domain-containing protein n=1 Tax=Aporhodopirellula rubra TaxID=980271 RepID=A0A7W5DVX2_9BACT|nr:DUF262 domain-containing protein [Aporhodopirellula rubra]MBB3205514.1 hypothetical protein [Aporhodopirellula rubra]